MGGRHLHLPMIERVTPAVLEAFSEEERVFSHVLNLIFEYNSLALYFSTCYHIILIFLSFSILPKPAIMCGQDDKRKQLLVSQSRHERRDNSEWPVIEGRGRAFTLLNGKEGRR